LSYPLTRNDFVENWEAVNALWHSFLPDEREIIFYAASWGYIPEDVLEHVSR